MLLSLIIRCYSIIFLSIGLASILLFVLGLRMIYKRASRPLPTKNNGNSFIAATKKSEAHALQRKNAKEDISQKSLLTITSTDIHAIAGEDALSTQLDLARAYIETGRKQLAKKILLYVAEQGNDLQQEEAKQLLSFV